MHATPFSSSPSAPALLEARGIYRSFPMGESRLQVLRGVDLSLRAGDFVAIAGSSGAGKSTLLHILGLLDAPDDGSLRYQGEELATLDEERKARVRNREFGFVFQFFHLLPDFTALENVLMPARIASGGFAWMARHAANTRRAHELLERVGLGARASHLPGQLSGGERQRVGIARALMNQPKLVFCDEPTGNLDSKTAHDIFALLQSLNAESGQTFVIVTHDDELASRAPRRLLMRDGLIVSEISNGQDIPHPLHHAQETPSKS